MRNMQFCYLYKIVVIEYNYFSGENLPVLQISDYEDFPLPFNLEDLLDSTSITIESLLNSNSPPLQPLTHHSLAESTVSETATSLKDFPCSGGVPFSFPSIIPAAFGLDSHMPSSSPNIFSSARRVPTSKVNQTSMESIIDTQLNFPLFPPFSPVAITPRNSFDTPSQSVGPRFLSNQQNVLIHETGQDVRMQRPLRPVMQSILGPHFQQQQKRPSIRLPAPVG